ncbi:MAG: hypothetical protein LBT38_12570 [Deltaproteobacteria bacterium]|jgi:TPR repeat protein|nr:hypothetical protein [Deltaproteobacteria bacterium]
MKRLVILVFFVALAFVMAGSHLALGEEDQANPPVDAQTLSPKTLELIQKAESGDLQARRELGRNYYYGREGLKQDQVLGVKWIRLSAEGGYPPAMNDMGIILWNGLGETPKDRVAAINWYRQAIEKDFARAYSGLGDAHRLGHGEVKPDFVEAVKWYLLGAEKGDIKSMERLAFMYKYGEGVEIDYSKALTWSQKAAEKGDKEAMFYLGEIYLFGEGVEKDYAQALNWFQKSADQGYMGAYFYLGSMHTNGYGVEKDARKGLDFFIKAAELGSEMAQLNVGLIYFNGFGVPVDKVEAIKWLTMAAENGALEAQYNLGQMFALGDETPVNNFEAAKWFRMAAAQDYLPAILKLAKIMEDGLGVEKNLVESFNLYLKAAKLGDPRAFYKLALAYAKGLGTIQNLNEAKWWGDQIPMNAKIENKIERTEFFFALSGFFLNKPLESEWGKEVWLKTLTNSATNIDLALTREEAESGDLKARFALGAAYELGLGAPQDSSLAFKWFNEAASQSHALSHFALGEAYKLGLGVEKDPLKALRHYQQSVSAGYKLAMFNVGMIYLEDSGDLPKDSSEKDYLRLAAEAGHVDAMFYLGVETFIKSQAYSEVYLSNLSVNNVEWLQKAAALGDPYAQYNLFLIFHKDLFSYSKQSKNKKKPVERKDALKFDKVKARNWLTLSAAQGLKEARFRLGRLCLEDDLKTRDLDEAIKWFKLDADLGDPNSTFKLAEALELKSPKGAKNEESFRLFHKLAEAGYGQARYKIALAYAKGLGTSQDRTQDQTQAQAISWLKKAAEADCHEAKIVLGEVYEFGLETPPDKEQALFWYLEAAERDVRAMVKVGDLYALDSKNSANQANVIKWYDKAYIYGDKGVSLKLINYYNALKVKDWSLAYKYNHWAAFQGQAEGMYHLTLLPPNWRTTSSIDWLIKAAGLGHPQAMYKLGLSYANGLDVPQDKALADLWLYKAAAYGLVFTDWPIEGYSLETVYDEDSQPPF